MATSPGESDWTHCDGQPHEPNVELRIDVSLFIGSLPEPARTILLLDSCGYSIAVIAAALNFTLAEAHRRRDQERQKLMLCLPVRHRRSPTVESSASP